MAASYSLPDGMMKFLQLIVAGLVLSANVYWELTPNAHAAGIAAFLITFLFTICIIKVGDLWCILRLAFRKQRADRGSNTRVDLPRRRIGRIDPRLHGPSAPSFRGSRSDHLL